MKRSTSRKLSTVFMYVALALFTLTTSSAGVAVVYMVQDKPWYIECANGDVTAWYCVNGKAWPW